MKQARLSTGPLAKNNREYRFESYAGLRLHAAYLNSGIFPNGSNAGLVSRLAAASAKAKGMNTIPSGMDWSARAVRVMLPRRVATWMALPGVTPRQGGDHADRIGIRNLNIQRFLVAA